MSHNFCRWFTSLALGKARNYNLNVGFWQPATYGVYLPIVLK